MSNKSELISDYLARIKETNSKSGPLEFRPNFFLVPRKNDIMLMEKSCNTTHKLNNIFIYYMEKSKKIQDIDLTALTREQREDFLLHHQKDFKIYNGTPIGELSNHVFNDFPILNQTPKNYINTLEIHKYFRGLGLSRELINEIINESVYNQIPSITATMVPLDKYTPVCIQKDRDKRLSEIVSNPDLKPDITIDDLSQIYSKLGFLINTNYKKLSSIHMSLAGKTIKDEDRLPDYFSEFKKHPKLPILVR